MVLINKINFGPSPEMWAGHRKGNPGNTGTEKHIGLRPSLDTAIGLRSVRSTSWLLLVQRNPEHDFV